MKKFLVFIVLCLVIGVSANAKAPKSKSPKAKTYKVEKTFEVYIDNSKVETGATLTGNSVVEIKENGYLMFVDNTGKKRYYLKRSCKSKIKDLIAQVKKPKSVTRSFLEEMMSMSERSAYSSAGNIERRPNIIHLNDLEVDENGEIKVYMIE